MVLVIFKMLRDSSIPWIFLVLLLLFRLILVEGGAEHRLLLPLIPESARDKFNTSCSDTRKAELGDSWSVGVEDRFVSGELINVEINLRGSSGGSLRLYLCSNIEMRAKCVAEEHALKNTDFNKTEVKISHLINNLMLQYQLPTNLSCTKCLLLWNFTANKLTNSTENVDTKFGACAYVDVVNDVGFKNRSLISDSKDDLDQSEDQNVKLHIPASVTEDAATEKASNEIKYSLTSENQTLTSLSASVVSSLTAGASTKASIVIIENRTVSMNPPLTTIESAEIISDENNGQYNEVPTEFISLDTVGNTDEVNKGVLVIKIDSETSLKGGVNVYTTAPVQPLEYNLTRSINIALDDKGSDNTVYEITRTKPPTESDSTTSTPAVETSGISLPTIITSPETTDTISELSSVESAGVSLVATTDSAPTTSTSDLISTSLSSSTSNLELTLTTPSFSVHKLSMVTLTTKFTTIPTSPTVPTEYERENPDVPDVFSTVLPVIKVSGAPFPVQKTQTELPTLSTTTTGPPTKTTVTKLRSKITTQSSTYLPQSPSSTPNKSNKISGEADNVVHEKKFSPSAINSINLQTVGKNLKAPNKDQSVDTNTTVIYQVYSTGPSLGYGLVLSVPPAIIFLVCLALVYMKKKYEVNSLLVKPHGQAGGGVRRLYLSVPKGEIEEGDEDVSQLTNMTSSTTLITNEFTPSHPTMCPEYAYIPDVVPSSVRDTQRPKLNDSVDESRVPRISLPNLSESSHSPENGAHILTDSPVIHYSSLNELSSNESSPDIAGKRWQSSGLEVEKSRPDKPNEGWTSHQRWKSEDWEKDQSFIAMLAKRLEHVDSRAEVTEL